MQSLRSVVCRLEDLAIREIPTLIEQVSINNSKSVQKLQLIKSSSTFYDLLKEVTTSPRQLRERITHSITSCHSLANETADVLNKLVQLLTDLGGCLEKKTPKAEDTSTQFVLYNISRNVLVQTNVLAFLLHQLILCPDEQSLFENSIRNQKQTLSVMLSKVRSLSGTV